MGRAEPIKCGIHDKHNIRGTWIHHMQNLATCGLRTRYKRPARVDSGSSIADMSTRTDSRFGTQRNETLDNYPERFDTGRGKYFLVYVDTILYKGFRAVPPFPSALNCLVCWNTKCMSALYPGCWRVLAVWSFNFNA